MKLRHATATLLSGAVAAAMFVVGVQYLASFELMPYHLQALGVPWSQLTPGCQALLLTLMKGTGLVGVVGGVSLAVLVAVPFRRAEPWSRWAMLVVGGTVLVPTLVGALRLRMATGASSPWWPHLAMLAALGLAFWLTRGFANCSARNEVKQ
jgi:hypothetical protein